MSNENLLEVKRIFVEKLRGLKGQSPYLTTLKRVFRRPITKTSIPADDLPCVVVLHESDTGTPIAGHRRTASLRITVEFYVNGAGAGDVASDGDVADEAADNLQRDINRMLDEDQTLQGWATVADADPYTWRREFLQGEGSAPSIVYGTRAVTFEWRERRREV